MKKLLAILLTGLLTFVVLASTAVAFDGNDYDYGGGGGGGGYDFDWGDDDYDYGYSSSSSSSSSGSGGNISPGLVILVIVIIIVVSVAKTKSSGTGTSNTPQPGRTITSNQGRNVILPDRTAQITEIIRQTDPEFSPDDFVSFAKQVYMDIQMAWCARDLTPVRPVLHENLYNTTCRQIEAKIRQGVVYHYESMTINTAYMTSYAVDNNYEYVTVYLNARMIDYQVDEKTGNIIRGDRSTRWDMRYKMKFVRMEDAVSNEATDDMNAHNCPNCGAPLEISSTGQCAYCGSVVSTGNYNWVLTDFTTVRDDTRDEGIRGVTNENSD